MHGHLDLNGNIHTSSPAAVDSWEETEAPSCHGENETAHEDFELRSEQSQHSISQGRTLTFMISSVLVKTKIQLQFWIQVHVYKMQRCDHGQNRNL